MIETLLGCSLGLVTVDESSYTVRLVRYTLQEYRSNTRDLFHSPHSAIAQTLTYLNFRLIRDPSPTLNRPPPATPLLEYVSCYWGAHARREVTESVNTLAPRLLDGFDKHASSRMLLFLGGGGLYTTGIGRITQRSTWGFTGLHGAVYLGITEILVSLLKMKKWDLGATDVGGNTAIWWAARRGHGAIVMILLE